ncbi:MAG: hypothetical protein ACRC20_03115 [Segniliparus sp.]|uniref:hypothetical protein n=1 Tax=Segniliparus sp. TaxID=2804064 RepID=UPI003F36FC77
MAVGHAATGAGQRHMRLPRRGREGIADSASKKPRSLFGPKYTINSASFANAPATSTSSTTSPSTAGSPVGEFVAPSVEAMEMEGGWTPSRSK